MFTKPLFIHVGFVCSEQVPPSVRPVHSCTLSVSGTAQRLDGIVIGKPTPKKTAASAYSNRLITSVYNTDMLRTMYITVLHTSKTHVVQSCTVYLILQACIVSPQSQ